MDEKIEQAFREKWKKKGYKGNYLEAKVRYFKGLKGYNDTDYEEIISELKEEGFLETPNNKLIEKPKAELKIHSPRSYNYVTRRSGEKGTIDLPYYTAKQEALIDFLFDELRKKAKKMSDEERSLIAFENYEMVLSERDKFPIALTGLSFTTTEVRKKLGVRFSDKKMIEDFKQLRIKSVNVKKEKIWADKNCKYKDEADWEGSVLSDIMAVKRTVVAPRTGEPLHKIHFCIGYVTGILWLNDIIRDRYCLFPREFYKLPEQCQKIFRYLSLWDEGRLNLRDFSAILNYGTAKNLSKRKNTIEGYLDMLKERKFIHDWRRVKGTRGLETQWYIWVKKPKA